MASSSWHHGCRPVTRRSVLAGLVAGGLAVVAGCIGEGDSGAVKPIALDDGQTCAVCGMVVADHYGPAVQAFYDSHPDGGSGPVPFDSVNEFVTFDAEQSTQGNDRIAAFATDYAQVDVTPIEGADGTYLPTVVSVDAFAPVEELRFVVESELKGAMGFDAMPVSSESVGEDLIADHGGELVDWETVASGYHR